MARLTRFFACSFVVLLALSSAGETGVRGIALRDPSVAEAGPLSQMVDVALDPGHSTWDVGAAYAGMAEHELTLDVAVRARWYLEQAGYSVRLTREGSGRVASVVPSDATEAIRVEQGARHAVAAPARAYVSVHFNAHPNRGLRGTETYVNSDNHGAASWRLGELLQSETLAALVAAGHAPVDRGVKEDLTAGKPYGHFFSLRGPFPSALIECLFLSNPFDAELLREEATRDAIARGIATGAARFLEG
jgi:N-acetylmuramoyl-L-alanine amidase